MFKLDIVRVCYVAQARMLPGTQSAFTNGATSYGDTFLYIFDTADPLNDALLKTNCLKLIQYELGVIFPTAPYLHFCVFVDMYYNSMYAVFINIYRM